MDDDLHHVLDWAYDRSRLEALIADGADVDEVHPVTGEPPLLVAARRRRLDAVRILVQAGAAVDGRDAHGKTAWVHSVRRGFDEVAGYLGERGASRELTVADELAVAMTRSDLDAAAAILATHPEAARTGNPGEDRLLADLAGREGTGRIRMLLDAGADIEARGLDDGTPLHQAAWFGQPENARILVEAGAPLDVLDSVHDATPLHWAVHGSRYSGGAESRQGVYVDIVGLLLDAGSSTAYPPELAAGASRSYAQRLHEDATPAVRAVLERHDIRPPFD